MDKNTAILIGIILSIIGFILIIYAVASYSALQERVGWYLDTFPSSTRYNQEIFTYGVIGVIGVIFLISGIFLSTADVFKDENKDIKLQKHVENRYCPECRRIIPIDAIICPYCRKDFRGKKIIDEKKIGFCPKCGVEIEDNPSFCFKCGFKLR